jgi:hypothetical protein
VSSRYPLVGTCSSWMQMNWISMLGKSHKCLADNHFREKVFLNSNKQSRLKTKHDLNTVMAQNKKKKNS